MARIFVVDDDRLILKSLELVLSRVGHEVVAFSGAEEAALRLGERPDLLVCDYHLPRVDGLELIEAAKRDHPSLKAILLSGGIEDERVTRAMRAGALDRFLTKPWRHAELAEAVASVLSR